LRLVCRLCLETAVYRASKQKQGPLGPALLATGASPFGAAWSAGYALDGGGTSAARCWSRRRETGRHRRRPPRAALVGPLDEAARRHPWQRPSSSSCRSRGPTPWAERERATSAPDPIESAAASQRARGTTKARVRRRSGQRPRPSSGRPPTNGCAALPRAGRGTTRTAEPCLLPSPSLAPQTPPALKPTTTDPCPSTAPALVAPRDVRSQGVMQSRSQCRHGHSTYHCHAAGPDLAFGARRVASGAPASLVAPEARSGRPPRFRAKDAADAMARRRVIQPGRRRRTRPRTVTRRAT